MAIESYRDLHVWQDSMNLARQIYRITKNFPKDGLYGLTSQMRRCSVSVPSNLAEGHARLSTKDYHRHVSIALGSLAELETQLILSADFQYTSDTDKADLLSTCSVIGRKLHALAKSLQDRINQS